MKPHKYGAKPQVIDGIRFASQKEAKRYCELKLLEKAGEISGLQLQPKFSIYAAPILQFDGIISYDIDKEPVKVGRYTADFAYFDRREKQRVIEDTKSTATATEAYRLRKKHVEAQYGIEIREV